MAFMMWICSIREIRENLWPEKSKTNAAQASHLGRIACECCACHFAAPGGEVCALETAFPKECPFLAHAAGDSSTNH
jgi:hypothetical protein